MGKCILNFIHAPQQQKPGHHMDELIKNQDVQILSERAEPLLKDFRSKDATEDFQSDL